MTQESINLDTQFRKVRLERQQLQEEIIRAGDVDTSNLVKQLKGLEKQLHEMGNEISKLELVRMNTHSRDEFENKSPSPSSLTERLCVFVGGWVCVTCLFQPNWLTLLLRRHF